ncbi:MAG: hypothetical protein ACOCP8_07905 [archaeon]
MEEKSLYRFSIPDYSGIKRIVIAKDKEEAINKIKNSLEKGKTSKKK